MKIRINNLHLVLISIPLGILLAPYLKEHLGEGQKISLLVVEAIKVLALPLIFLAILESFIKAEFTWKGLRSLLLVCLINGVAALTIALTLSALFPGPSSVPSANPSSSPFSHKMLTPLEFFTKSPMMITIVCAVFLGFFYSKTRKFFSLEFSNKISSNVTLLFSYASKLIQIAVKFIPLVVFFSVVRIVVEKNYQSVGSLLNYLVLCALGMFLQVALTYQSWVLGKAKIPFRKFWSEAKTPAIYAFSINSSLVTLPLTLKSLDKLKVSKESARLSACLGTNFNNDGILLYEVIAVLFIIHSYSISLSLTQKITTSFFALLAAIGVGGIPEAGIISLSLVLSSVGLPLEHIPLLLTVDWILARLRSATNVLGDITVAIAIDSLKKGETT